jgi:outer membrane protein assembly factor BamB
MLVAATWAWGGPPPGPWPHLEEDGMTSITRAGLLLSLCLLSVGSARAGLGDALHKQVRAGGQAGDAHGSALAVAGTFALVGAPGADALGGVDSGSVEVTDARTGAFLRELQPVGGKPGDAFGAAVSAHGRLAVVGAPGHRVGGVVHGAAWLFDLTTGQQLVKLVPPAGGEGDGFGSSVAVFGRVVAVGAPGDDTGGADRGQVFLFDASSGALQQTLQASEGLAGDSFGASVALDVGRVLVGAPESDAAGSDAGSVCVFDSATGSELGGLSSPLTVAFDRFGSALAAADGVALVGAPRHDALGGNAGAAYLFDLTTLQPLWQLLPPSAKPGDLFGTSVSLDGGQALVGSFRQEQLLFVLKGGAYLFDVGTGAHRATLVPPDLDDDDLAGSAVALDGGIALVGAPQDDDLGTDSGSVTAFDGVDALPPLAEVLPPVASFPQGRFGGAVAIDGELAVVGSDDAFGGGDGFAVILDLATGATLHTLQGLPQVGHDEFGHAVTIDGDLVAVGAPRADGVLAGANAGAVYLFDAVTGALLHKLVAADGVAGDDLGWSIALADGLVLAGAPQTGPAHGSAYLFDAATGAELHELTLIGNNPWETGTSVALHDGVAYVGSPQIDVTGAVHRFDVITGAELGFLLPPTGGGDFGELMAVDGDLLAIGAPFNGSSIGSVFVYDLASGAAPETLSLGSTPGLDDYIHALDIAGELVLVGKHLSDVTGNANGEALLLDRRTGQALEVVSVDGLATNDFFGHGVAIDGTTMMVGAPGKDDAGEDAGMVYLRTVPDLFWDDLGGGLAGVTGIPDLSATGQPTANGQITLRLDRAAAAAPTFLVLGYVELGLSIKGGVLVPSPQELLLGLPTDGAGVLALPATMPPAVPSGVDVLIQIWVQDAEGLAGVSASNTLFAVTP